MKFPYVSPFWFIMTHHAHTTTAAKTLQLSQQHDTTTHRIVSGKVTSIERYKYMVFMKYGNNKHWCGVSLIESGWVLSAAHCSGKATHILRLEDMT